MTSVSDEAATPLLYVLELGGHRVAYQPNGQALFYDIPLQTAGARHMAPGSDLGDSPMGFMNGVAMSRLQLTADGRVCAYATRATQGAIMSFWIERDADGHARYSYRTVDDRPHP